MRLFSCLALALAAGLLTAAAPSPWAAGATQPPGGKGSPKGGTGKGAGGPRGGVPKEEPKAAPPAPAERKTTPAMVDERLFALYAIEDMALQFAPAPADRAAAKVNPQAAVIRRLAELRAEVAYQRLVYDTLRLHLQKLDDPQFLAIYGVYAEQLALVGAELKSLNESLKLTTRAAGQVQAAASATALGAGLAYGLRAADGGADSNQAFATGLGAMMVAAAAQQKQVSAEQKQLSQELDAARKAFEGEFAARIKQSAAGWQKAVGASRWGDGEFAFRAGAAAARNPFAVARRAAARDASATPGELVRKAEACAKAAEMVPAAAAFDPFRALILGVAGRLASEAAEKDLGAAGFPAAAADAPAGGKLAVAIWGDYLRAESVDRNVNDEVVRAVALAHAYAGDRAAAYEMLKAHAAEPTSPRGGVLGRPAPAPTRVKADFSSRPGFWYDAARVCSSAEHTTLALECLKRAVACGFADKEDAQVSPDLKSVRTGTTQKEFQRLFDAAPGRGGFPPRRPE